MAEWWEALTVFQKVLYCIAVPSTMIVLIQTIMVLCGFGEGGEGLNASDTSGIDLGTDGMDFPADTDLNMDGVNGDISSHEGFNPADAGNLKMFTVQTVMAFLCVFGWTAIVTVNGGSSPLIASLTGALLGVIAMYCIAKLIQQSARLAENGTFNPKNALGGEATVYIPIAARRGNTGKISIIVQGTLMECEAITEGEVDLKTGDKVKVTDIVGDTMVVEKL